MIYHLVKIIAYIAFKIAFNIRFEGRNNIPKGEAVIYASNHRTNADPPIVACRGKGKFAFMAKEELFRNKLFALLIRSLGAFPVARGKGDTGVLDTAIERLESGRSLIIFPEGTRSKDGKVHRGHSGAAVIAAKSQKKIIPVGIVFGERLKFRTKITVKYGEPINPNEYIDQPSDPNPRQLVKLKNRYMADIKQLVECEADNGKIRTENEDE